LLDFISTRHVTNSSGDDTRMSSTGQLAAMELKSYKGLPMNSEGSGMNIRLQ